MENKNQQSANTQSSVTGSKDLNEKIRLAELYIKALSLEKSYSLSLNQTGIQQQDRFILNTSIRTEIESNLLELIKSLK